MSVYRNNHYVPVWYQERFIQTNSREQKFYFLDLKPEVIDAGKKQYKRNELLRWGPRRCFCEQDLYTTKYGEWLSTDIEKHFFGPIDAYARPALDYFANFEHPDASGDMFERLMVYMSLQKLRTPKGMVHLSRLIKNNDKNLVLRALQQLQQLFCAIWTECVWSIADATDSDTKFLLSDHPVTVYNQGCFPGSNWCKDNQDPDIWLTGTHTLFPLTSQKLLILTNLSWVRYPYGNPVKLRPNPNPLRPAMFNFTSIQTGRKLKNDEVLQINYIIKKRAYRYVAADNKDWLYPEKALGLKTWSDFGRDYLLMPDPRCLSFSGEIIIGFEGGGGDSFDAYGRKPWQADYDGGTKSSHEWETFHAFQGEFARKFGKARRGLAYEFGKLSPVVDNDDYHQYHLDSERKYKKYRFK